MSPIEQIKPALPSNWTRRPENRNKRVEPGARKDRDPKDHRNGDSGDRSRPGDGSGGRDHIVDELA